MDKAVFWCSDILAKIISLNFSSRLIKKFMENYWYEGSDLEKSNNIIIKVSPRLKHFGIFRINRIRNKYSYR